MANNLKKWKRAAMHCVTTYGVFADSEERFFECPECGEPLYEDDWGCEATGNWHYCPICEFDFHRV